MDFLFTKIDETWDPPANLVDKMNDLKKKLQELNAIKEDVESRRRIELHPRKKLKKEVELWLNNIERINAEIKDLQQKFGQSNVFLRGILKGKVLEKIQEVEELLQKGRFHDGLVVDDPRWIGQALSATALFGQTAEVCMKEIWACLIGVDVQKIGVCGMGGIGKTTIMKLIHNQLLKETEKFDIVIWITVSKEMSIIKLQNKIARAMNVILYEDEDKTIRAGMIHEMLAHKGKFVLILDDLWDKISLEEVGIPEPFNGKVRVPILSKQDASGLFLEKVGQDVLNHLDLLPTVQSVVEECSGLPLAIVTIASSMKGVRNIHEWRNALHELKRHVKSVNEMEEKVFQQLQFSYDRLHNEKVKRCVLCTALYPEDCEIDTDELIKLWIAEGLVEEMDSMQMEIDKGYIILCKIKNSCLIENSTLYKDRVKLHDLVRDMALRITSLSPRFLVRAGIQLKGIWDVQDWSEDLEKASLMENWQLKIPSQLPPPKCHKLTTLLLSKCYIQSVPECFFEQMYVLKVLDLSDNLFKSLPNSISNLVALNTLLLCGCKRLENVPSFSKLQALKKLDLGGTNIKNIPHGMERLENLKYLDLSKTKITRMVDGTLAKLTSLRYLNTLGKIALRGKEMGGLKKLESFNGRFYDLSELNNYAQALHASIKTPSQYSICVGHGLGFGGLFCSLEKLFELIGCKICADGIKILSDVEGLIIFRCISDSCEQAFLSWFIPVPFSTFSSLSRMEIIECTNVKKLLSSIWVLQNLQNLGFLHVRDCENVEEVIASKSESEDQGTSVFKFILPKLSRLELRDLPKLKSICGANGVMVCDSIQEIEITNCPKLKRIPLNLPLQDDGQPSPPPCLRTISISSGEWWELLEWDHPNAKSVLEPYIENWEWQVC